MSTSDCCSCPTQHLAWLFQTHELVAGVAPKQKNSAIVGPLPTNNSPTNRVLEAVRQFVDQEVLHGVELGAGRVPAGDDQRLELGPYRLMIPEDQRLGKSLSTYAVVHRGDRARLDQRLGVIDARFIVAYMIRAAPRQNAYLRNSDPAELSTFSMPTGLGSTCQP